MPHATTPATPAIPINPTLPTPEDCDGDFWFSLIPDTEAAEFIGLTPRFLEVRRQQGGGPKFVKVSARCIRYRRADLKQWADDLLRASTADAGTPEAA